MPSISSARALHVEAEPGSARSSEPLVSAVGPRDVIRLFAVVLGAASLAACAQSSVVTNNSERSVVSRQATPERNRSTFLATNRRTGDTAKHIPLPSKNAADTLAASHGLASFYSTGTRTASGERFDKYAMTAAHPTLPFGTRLRVTSVATGRSVTVRIIDRGPFVRGRVVDVSHSAAEALGMVGDGVAKVKLDVVR
jgi:rare lipoprotein A